MEEDDRPSRRKFKFKPKAPPQRKPQLASSKTGEATDDGDASLNLNLLRRANENLGRSRPKVEKKSPVQVVFGPGAPSSSTKIREYGNPKKEDSGMGGSSEPGDSQNERSLDYPSASVAGDLAFAGDSSSKLIRTKYKEPWDYVHSYYPTTLPLRKPYSGDPELLDEAEFGLAAKKDEFNENAIKPAVELRLLEESEEERMLFFQFPSHLPSLKQPLSTKGKEKVDSSAAPETTTGVSKKNCRLEELPGGYMGKMLVYKSGAVKLKLGDLIYDVSPGTKRHFMQEVAAINASDGRHCCALGEISEHAVVTPDIDSLLNSTIDLG